MTNKKT